MLITALSEADLACSTLLILAGFFFFPLLLADNITITNFKLQMSYLLKSEYQREEREMWRLVLIPSVFVTAHMSSL